MNHRTWLLPLLLASAAAASAGVDLDLSVIAEIRLGKAPPPPPPEIVVIEAPKTKGPPPWAPASGFRRNRAYYFYPAAHVYYRPADRMWFYLEGRDWRVGVSLPTTTRIDFTRCIPLEMETDRPFDHHVSIVEHYPADYFAQVRIRTTADNAADSEKPGRAPPKSKDKGKGKNR